jgi:hypothetical protein
MFYFEKSEAFGIKAVQIPNLVCPVNLTVFLCFCLQSHVSFLQLHIYVALLRFHLISCWIPSTWVCCPLVYLSTTWVILLYMPNWDTISLRFVICGGWPCVWRNDWRPLGFCMPLEILVIARCELQYKTCLKPSYKMWAWYVLFFLLLLLFLALGLCRVHSSGVLIS